MANNQRNRTRADLHRVFDALNCGYFSQKIFKCYSVRVDAIDWMDCATENVVVERGWFSGRPSGLVIKYGLCDITRVGQRQWCSIYISNFYRSRLVPGYVLARTMGHEMLHGWLPCGEGHSARHQRLEHELPGFGESEAWRAGMLEDGRIIQLAEYTDAAARNGELIAERTPDHYPRTIPQNYNAVRHQPTTIRAASSRLVSLAPRG